jgi:glutamate--cysteine ligase
VDSEHRSFKEWMGRANPTLDEWHDHLSTLFPEIRPRGHLELRSADAIAPQWYAAPLALSAGMLYDPGALRAADDLLGAPDPSLLDHAGRWGLHDPAMARTAADLFEIALRGCGALGPRYFHPSDLEQATGFYESYTRRGRAPADEVVENAIAA